MVLSSHVLFLIPDLFLLFSIIQDLFLLSLFLVPRLGRRGWFICSSLLFSFPQRNVIFFKRWIGYAPAAGMTSQPFMGSSLRQNEEFLRNLSWSCWLFLIRAVGSSLSGSSRPLPISSQRLLFPSVSLSFSCISCSVP